MDKIKEEVDGVNPLYNDGWLAGQKSRDEEIKKAVQAEREACALVCDNIADEIDYGDGFQAAIQCEKAIRARK